MDVTDGIGYKSNLQDTLLFRALTAKGAVRLRSVWVVTAVIQEISGTRTRYIPSNQRMVITSVPSTFRNKKTVALNAESYHFTKES
jgi:signal peptidase I